MNPLDVLINRTEQALPNIDWANGSKSDLKAVITVLINRIGLLEKKVEALHERTKHENQPWYLTGQRNKG